MMEDEYYLNTRTGKVERGKRSGWQDRMGPYPTREAAEHAYEIAEVRNQSSDENEKEWKEEWEDEES
ncbi:hypothetical protein VR010_09585 [Actinomycetaceae bacterium L2_0104]